MSRAVLTIAFLLVAGSVGPTLAADVPQLISYQGLLTLQDGSVVPDGPYTLKFSIWDNVTGGTQHFFQALSVEVEDGLYNVILSDQGSGDLATALKPDGLPRYMQVEILSGGGGTFTVPVTLEPRQQIASVPYSLHSAGQSAAIGIISGPISYTTPLTTPSTNGDHGTVTVDFSGRAGPSHALVMGVGTVAGFLSTGNGFVAQLNGPGGLFGHARLLDSIVDLTSTPLTQHLTLIAHATGIPAAQAQSFSINLQNSLPIGFLENFQVTVIDLGEEP